MRWWRVTGRPAHHFFRDNARLRAELEEIEERACRRDLLVEGDDDIYALYDARIPAGIVSARHFDAWWKKQRHKTPDLLTFTRDDLPIAEDGADNPDTDWRTGDLELPLTLTGSSRAPRRRRHQCTSRSACWPRLGGDGFAWQVPALREELVTALIVTRPRIYGATSSRPPDTARAILGDIDPSRGVRCWTEIQRRTAQAQRHSGADRRLRSSEQGP